MIVSDMHLQNMPREEVESWFDELLEAYDYIVEEYDLTAPQLHDALVSLELGTNIAGIPKGALLAMHHSEIGHVDPSWIASDKSVAILRRDEDGARYFQLNDMKLTPTGCGYWAVEKGAGEALELVKQYIDSDGVRELVNQYALT